MNIRLFQLKKEQATHRMILWLRESNMSALRTRRVLTKEDQEKWFDNISSSGTDEWWSIHHDRWLRGYCGIEHIDWRARTGELSLLCYTDVFANAFDALIEEGFTNLALRELHAEVYHCSPFHALWCDAGKRYNAQVATLPMRKWWQGQYYDADWISIRMPV